VRMDQLKIGDFVLTGDGTYSKVYSFGHLTRNQLVEYLQIQTKTAAATTKMDQFFPALEISAVHMLYVNGKLAPAGQIQVGDSLTTVLPTEKDDETHVSTVAVTVKSIRKVQRRGAYAPLTGAGNLVVNGVVASSYVSLEWIPKSVSGDALFYLQHIGTLPLRVYCTMLVGGCAHETYSEGHGLNAWVAFWFSLEEFWLARWLVTLLLELWSIPSMTCWVAAALGFYIILWKNKKSHSKATTIHKAKI